MDEQINIDNAKLRCTYMLYFQLDSTNREDVRSERMELFIGDKCSRFISFNELAKDSLIVGFGKKGTPVEVMLSDVSIFPKTKFKQVIYKNYPDDEITVIDRLGGKKYIYNHPYGEFNWHIKHDTTTIAAYKCQLATTRYAGRDYEAWFTLEIPISEGPYKFHGLPGLIVRIHDTKQHYDYELIRVMKLEEKYPITYPKREYPWTSLENFKIMEERWYENILERFADRQVKFENEEQKIRVKTKHLSWNNPIELVIPN